MVQMIISLTHMKSIKLLMSVQACSSSIDGVCSHQFRPCSSSIDDVCSHQFRPRSSSIDDVCSHQFRPRSSSIDDGSLFNDKWRLLTTLQAPFLKEKKGVRF
ncbi:hypothetical protein Tco_0311096, partial [Tanacetum coccineum]